MAPIMEIRESMLSPSKIAKDKLLGKFFEGKAIEVRLGLKFVCKTTWKMSTILKI
jgi:hypothetical protein